jgi:hypothetical protein
MGLGGTPKETMAERAARTASPERWVRAAERAITEGISVRQVNSSGAWVANSGTHANVAYLLEIANGVVHSCSCPAGTFGDPCCKHAARYYLDMGILDGPEGDGTAAVAA